MAERIAAAIEAITKGRTSCFLFGYFGSTIAWMRLHPD